MSTELNPTTGLVVDIFGPTIEFLIDPREAQNTLCLLRGVIPHGVTIPLHNHADIEEFLVISGEIQALKQDTQTFEWIVGKAGDYIHVPGGAPHAFRNVSSEPVIAFIITTAKIGRFFQEVGRPATGAPQPVTPEELAHFAATAAKYGYWLASPEENAAVGIHF